MELSFMELSFMELSFMELSFMELSVMELSFMELSLCNCRVIWNCQYSAKKWEHSCCILKSFFRPT